MTVLIIIAVNLLFSSVLYLLLRRRIDNRTTDKARLEPVRDQINQLIIELDQTTERNIQLLENKIEELKSLSQGSGREIEMLQRKKEEYSLAMERYRELGRRESLAPPAPEPEEPPPVAKEEAPEEKSPKEQVLIYHRQGLDSDAISRKVGLPKGEVELIITMGTMGR